MNEFQAFPEPTIGGYVIMLRFPKDGKPKPVLLSPERPHIVHTQAEAWEECTKHLLRFVNGNYRSESCPIESPKQKAEKLFRKGRVIEVQRRAI